MREQDNVRPRQLKGVLNVIALGFCGVEFGVFAFGMWQGMWAGLTLFGLTLGLPLFVLGVKTLLVDMASSNEE